MKNCISLWKFFIYFFPLSFVSECTQLNNYFDTKQSKDNYSNRNLLLTFTKSREIDWCFHEFFITKIERMHFMVLKFISSPSWPTFLVVHVINSVRWKHRNCVLVILEFCLSPSIVDICLPFIPFVYSVLHWRQKKFLKMADVPWFS